MKKVLTFLLVLCLLAGLQLPARAAGAPTFSYRMELTDDAGQPVSPTALISQSAGSRLHLKLQLQRTDISDASYDIYGIEFQVASAGLSYQGDGQSFRAETPVAVAHYPTSEVVGFTWIDLEERAETIANPVELAQWSYTVDDPKNAWIRLDVALVYSGGKEPSPVFPNYDLRLDPNGGTIPEGADVSGTLPAGTVVQLPTPTRPGYRFVGWSDGSDTWAAGDYTVTKAVVLTAQWSVQTSTPTPTPKPAYTAPDWVGPALETKQHPNYVVGYPDGSIHPRAGITRAEVAVIFYRLLTEDSRARYQGETNAFPDVADADWFHTAVSTLTGADILRGYPDGKFYPDRPITRAELTAIITRFVRRFGGVAPFNDVDGHWAYDNIAQAAQNGWIKGYEDGSFRPDVEISRAETFAMVNRMLGRQPETASDLAEGMNQFPDNQDSAEWYYLDVQEAANNHSYQRKADGFHERWTAKLEDIRW